MNRFSSISKQRLKTCDEKLQILFTYVLNQHDCTILCGYRNEEEQNKLFHEGKTKVRYPYSQHNKTPSRAVDVAPYPIPRWEDLTTFAYFAGIVMGTAHSLGIKIRWGGDFNQNNILVDESFKDYVHFELKD